MRQTTSGPLIGMGAADESIGYHQIPPFQSGLYDFFDDLCPTGHVQEHLTCDRHFLMGYIKQDLSDSLADRGTTRLAKFGDMGPFLLGPIDEPTELGALARTIRSVKDQKSTAEYVRP